MMADLTESLAFKAELFEMSVHREPLSRSLSRIKGLKHPSIALK